MLVVSKQSGHIKNDSISPVGKVKCKENVKLAKKSDVSNVANNLKPQTSKIIDPCFKNVLRKELANERAERSGKARSKAELKSNKSESARHKILFKNDQTCTQVKQVSENNSAKPINADQEDLDYYDDVLQIRDGIEVMVGDTE